MFFQQEALMSRFFDTLDSRKLFATDLPGLDPGDVTEFNGVRIDASNFPAGPVTVQQTNNGEIVNLPLLRDGVVTATATGGIDDVLIQNRIGADDQSDLPGIVFYGNAGSGGLQIFGSVSEALAAFDEIALSLEAALNSLRETRDVLAGLGLPTAQLDQQIISFSASIAEVNAALQQTLTSAFVRVRVAGTFDSYFLASQVNDVVIDTGAGNDRITSTLTGERQRINGGQGDDVITAATRATLQGGAGNDRLVAGASSWLDGGAGNDSLMGSAQSDIMVGGGGTDYFYTANNGQGVMDFLVRSVTRTINPVRTTIAASVLS